MAISAGIITGLMFIVVQLLQTDQRESSRSETQREMQLALDYISNELREAVYIYTGTQLDCVNVGGICRGALTDYLPASLTQNSVPVLAFWKQQSFPDSAKNWCRTNTPRTTAGVACEAGSSYALVVYSLSTANNGNIWQGNARLTRYVLPEFSSSSALTFNRGYVSPGSSSNFATWPLVSSGAGVTNLQNRADLPSTTNRRPTGVPDGSPVVLVDFVEDNTPATSAACPAGYNISPSDTRIAAAPGRLSNARTFYACVSPRISMGTNQDAIVFLQGSVDGRAGYTTGFARSAETLPALETRVLARGVLDRPPQ
ncbi:MAG: hypothetical protein Kow00121_12820 [Elainellaceae cyanobacterium]